MTGRQAANGCWWPDCAPSSILYHNGVMAPRWSKLVICAASTARSIEALLKSEHCSSLLFVGTSQRVYLCKWLTAGSAVQCSAVYRVGGKGRRGGCILLLLSTWLDLGLSWALAKQTTCSFAPMQHAQSKLLTTATYVRLPTANRPKTVPEAKLCSRVFCLDQRSRYSSRLGRRLGKRHLWR